MEKSKAYGLTGRFILNICFLMEILGQQKCHELLDIMPDYPFLWDKRMKLHNDKIAVANGWMEIAHLLREEVDDVKTAWKSMRTRYVRDQARYHKFGELYNDSWPFAEGMTFLDPVIDLRLQSVPHHSSVAKHSAVTFEDSDDGCDGTLDNSPDDMDGVPYDNMLRSSSRKRRVDHQHSSSISPEDDLVSLIGMRRNKRAKNDSSLLSLALIKYLDKNTNTSREDEYDIFGKSIASQVRSLPAAKWVELRFKIEELVYKAKLECTV